MHIEDWEHRQNEDDQVQDAVHENTAEEEHGLVNGARSVHALVPDVFNREALENGQAGAYDDPKRCHDEENLDRNANHRELEDAPVECEEGDLGGGDRGGIAE